MNLRIDKVVRFASFGARRVYSLVLTDDCLYLIRTGSFGALKHYRVDSASRLLIADRPDDRSVKEIQANEARIDSMALDQLIGGGSYVVRLGAIEGVAIQTGTSPIMILKLTGSDHRFMFPFAPIEQVQTLRSALLRSDVV